MSKIPCEYSGGGTYKPDTYNTVIRNTNSVTIYLARTGQNITANTPILLFTLPEEDRPLIVISKHIFIGGGASGAVPAVATVYTDGRVTINSSADVGDVWIYDVINYSLIK